MISKDKNLGNLNSIIYKNHKILNQKIPADLGQRNACIYGSNREVVLLFRLIVPYLWYDGQMNICIICIGTNTCVQYTCMFLQLRKPFDNQRGTSCISSIKLLFEYKVSFSLSRFVARFMK